MQAKSYCGFCGSELVEYLGFGIKSGDGEWYCTKCEKSDGVPEEVEPDDDLTPPGDYKWGLDGPFVSGTVVSWDVERHTTSFFLIWVLTVNLINVVDIDPNQPVYYKGKEFIITEYTHSISSIGGCATKVVAKHSELLKTGSLIKTA